MPHSPTATGALAEELAFARELAHRVGQRALQMQRQGSEALAAREKPDDGGPVTLADLEANETIVAAIRDRFPGDGILAEESVNDAGARTRERVWMIDPIDGTREFAKGLDAWAVHIGLTVAGHPALGVVARPSAGYMLWGRVGDANAWQQRGGSTAVALPPPTHNTATARMIASASRYSARVGALSDELGIDESRRMRSGSTGVKMATLCLGQAEIYAHGSGGLSLWDTCAPMAILMAAGGHATGLRGDALDHGPDAQVHSGGLLATRGVDHNAVAEVVQRIGSTWFDADGLTRE